MDSKPIPREVASKIYDMLQQHCGATDYWRENFLQCQGDGCREYRFQGSLGFGGKFWSESWRVSCYIEDETPERMQAIKAANESLAELHKEYQS